MEKSDIPFLTATQLSRLIGSREVSPVEATEAYLERIAREDGRLNAYITVCGDEALVAAREAEEAIAAGRYLGPMHGIPVAIKDQIHTKGILTTAGSGLLADYVPTEDATVMANLKRAGAVLLGKLHLYEFAMAGLPQRFKTPRNPWNLDMSTGGSSSGSGAATAASLCATSLGEDTGGSIRFPATWCGLSGLRPSWGRVSRHGVIGASWSMDTVGPLSRTVEDCAMTLQAIAGYDHRDPYTWNIPVPNYVAALDGHLKGVRVGVLKEQMEHPQLHPEYEESVVKAIRVLGELGASVEEVSIPITLTSGVITSCLVDVEWASVHQETFTRNLEELDPNNRVRFFSGSLMPAQAYYKSQRLRALLRRQVLEALDKVNVLVLPTGMIPAPPLKEDVPAIQGKETVAERLAGRITFTCPFNLAGVPALSLPCGYTSTGLPLGLQIVGPPFAEEAVFKVAHAYQQSTPWHEMKPAL